MRIFDFGGDKTPPFLRGTGLRGSALMLEHEPHLRAQLVALLRVGRPARLRILAPLVESPGQLIRLRTLLADAGRTAGWEGALPPLGAMVETPRAVEQIDEIAAAADFISIGTNDLVQYTLGLDRGSPRADVRAVADLRVLDLIARIAGAAARAGRPLEVCGEAAGDPQIAGLLVGLGVGELSVAPVRLAGIRALLGSLSYELSTAAARRALAASDQRAVLEIAHELAR